MSRRKKRDDGKVRIKFSTLIREDLYLKLHKIALDRDMKVDLYMLVEDAVEDFVKKHLPEG